MSESRDLPGTVSSNGSRAPAPAPDVRRSVATAILAVAVVAVSAAAVGLVLRGAGTGSHGSARTPRTLPAPNADRVLFVLFPDFPEPVADQIRNDIAARYHLPGSIFISSTPLDPAAWNAERRQFGAERAIDTMLRQTLQPPGRTVVIGLTSQDLYIESVDWNWAFALRRHGAALVSMARMHAAFGEDHATALMRKMVVRELGFLAWGLAPTDDPGDLMYRDVLGLDDLERMADDL